MKNDLIYKQATKEARWAIALTIFYMLGWCVLAYGFSIEKGLLGFPLWFELSCLYFPLLFSFIVYFCIKYVFQDLDLGGDDES
ncbi:DUF997 family protein [[Haemophilus] felis]|nr:DUF997 family protein [[Haemophilus] felis]